MWGVFVSVCLSICGMVCVYGVGVLCVSVCVDAPREKFPTSH